MFNNMIGLFNRLEGFARMPRLASGTPAAPGAKGFGRGFGQAVTGRRLRDLDLDRFKNGSLWICWNG